MADAKDTAGATHTGKDAAPRTATEAFLTKWRKLYGDAHLALGREVVARAEACASRSPQTPRRHFTERDALLIAYGDHVHAGPETGLRTLHTFARRRLRAFSGVHILPHFPFTSDDGFSVVDYRKVDPALGTWEDIRAFATDFELMFDAVINHISASSAWFQGYLQGEEKYEDWFIAADPSDERLARVYRPRATPLLTPFERPSGQAFVWTTFSADQIDLNYANPSLAAEIVDLLIDYAERGASYLRLDAIGFLWKELGTRSFHQPETHLFVQMLRDVFDVACPNMALVPEINGPYEENLPYLGNGNNEAQLVYNFTLPPLILHAFAAENARWLGDWLAEVRLPAGSVSLFNFIASHDGLGVRAAQGLLPEAEMQRLLDATERRGAPINYRKGESGELVPYEINGTLYDLLNDADTPEDEGVARMAVAHCILFALSGVPGVYFHSLFSTPSWREGWKVTGHNRTLNRFKFPLAELEAQLDDPQSRASLTLAEITEALSVRRAHAAFAPGAPQVVLQNLPEAVLAIRRGEEGDSVWCLHNLSTSTVQIKRPLGARGEVLLRSGRSDAATGDVIELPGLSALWLS